MWQTKQNLRTYLSFSYDQLTKTKSSFHHFHQKIITIFKRRWTWKYVKVIDIV